MAFAIPAFQGAQDPYGIYTLVLTPTRELAFQISEQFVVLGGSLNLRTAVIVGGMDMMEQAPELGRRPHVAVAIPGHWEPIWTAMESSRVALTIPIGSLYNHVLDEADRLLTDTFADDLAQILSKIPKERQTCLLMTTWTPAIENPANATPQPGKQKPFIYRMTDRCALAFAYIGSMYSVAWQYGNRWDAQTPLPARPLTRSRAILVLRAMQPTRIDSTHARSTSRAPKAITQIKENEAFRPPKLDETAIKQPPPTIIFVSKPRTSAYLAKLLQTLRNRATAQYSRLKQRERLNLLNLFRLRVVPVLISTDVGARGVDIADVALVVNWDFPSPVEDASCGLDCSSGAEWNGG
ncbi:P-loop containing nucleoside triphosphate hydrolase protein [Rhizoctonia solani]|nr:P-loop containing nucleoside triphosphate hydrolase protein [Rhizoctonia solani]